MATYGDVSTRVTKISTSSTGTAYTTTTGARAFVYVQRLSFSGGGGAGSVAFGGATIFESAMGSIIFPGSAGIDPTIGAFLSSPIVLNSAETIVITTNGTLEAVVVEYSNP
jgi:hypothetical protein